MGLFERVSRIIRANLNALISSAEDPEKILNQTIQDMAEDHYQMRQAVAQAIAAQKRLERQYEQAQQSAEEWHRRAELALRNNNEALAREALVRKKTFVETAQSLKRQLDEQTRQVEMLKTNMTKLESKIAEAKTKKDMLIARARAAKASQQINQVIGRVDPSSAFAAFERMEEKVNALEAQSAAVAELAADSLEQQFAALEAGGADVDQELRLLKAAIQAQLPAGETEAAQQGQAGAPTGGKVDVDAELEELRREIDQL
ncbi:PspA/IM30 family protein [Synechococcus sp. W70.1]|uniref:PspA/IM30 family protein n=1 Tax=Synechococcus sp. W70.1 TaxID=2964534 RepID=UPI0039C4686F